MDFKGRSWTKRYDYQRQPQNRYPRFLRYLVHYPGPGGILHGGQPIQSGQSVANFAGTGRGGRLCLLDPVAPAADALSGRIGPHGTCLLFPGDPDRLSPLYRTRVPGNIGGAAGRPGSVPPDRAVTGDLAVRPRHLFRLAQPRLSPADLYLAGRGIGRPLP